MTKTYFNFFLVAGVSLLTTQALAETKWTCSRSAFNDVNIAARHCPTACSNEHMEWNNDETTPGSNQWPNKGYRSYYPELCGPNASACECRSIGTGPKQFHKAKPAMPQAPYKRF